MLTFDPSRHDAAIFDCDGTLVDTMPIHHAAWQSAFRQFGAPFEFSWALFNRRAGMTLERTVEELNREFHCQLPPEQVANAQRQAYQRSAIHLQPIWHVVRFARQIAENHPIAVASGSNRASVEDALQQIDLLSAFRAIVTAGDVEHGKPAPDVFLLAATLLGVQPSRCLVIEDGELGLVAAQRAGMDAYRVDRDGMADWISHRDHPMERTTQR